MEENGAGGRGEEVKQRGETDRRRVTAGIERRDDGRGPRRTWEGGKEG